MYYIYSNQKKAGLAIINFRHSRIQSKELHNDKEVSSPRGHDNFYCLCALHHNIKIHVAKTNRSTRINR